MRGELEEREVELGETDGLPRELGESLELVMRCEEFGEAQMHGDELVEDDVRSRKVERFVPPLVVTDLIVESSTRHKPG